MAMVQLYGDSLENYDPVCRPLKDLGFQIIPQLGLDWGAGSTNYSNIADVWIIISYVSFFLITSFLVPKPLLVITRFFWIMSINFFLRTLVIGVTRYPKLPFAVENYRPGNLFIGALLVVVGARTTATDIMFSGHTLGFITTASFISRYMNHQLFSILYWVFNIFGILALLTVREHYSADILMAIFIARLVFSNYHLFLDSEYFLFWESSVRLSGNARIVLPAKIVDSLGNETNIGEHGTQLSVSHAVTQPRLVQHKNGQQYFVQTVETYKHNRTGARSRVMNFFKWLDSE